MTESQKITTGGCLCGAVRYEVKGPLRDVVNCHCSMCQRLHGNFGPHSKARKVNISITNDTGLAWYKDGPTGLKTVGHIFVGEKCDFYEITDSLPQYQGSSNGALVNDYK